MTTRPATGPTADTRRDSAPRRPLVPGRAWPVIIVAMLGLNVAVCALTVTVSLRTPYATEPEYYQKAIDWDQTKAESVEAGELGWTAALSVTPGGALRLDLRGPDGRAVAEPREVAIAATAFHHADSGRRVELGFAPVGDAFEASLAGLPRDGMHEIRLRIVTPDTIARAVRTLEIAR